LKAGSIQGGVIASPATAEAKRLGMRELVNMANLGIEYPQTTIATNGRYLRSNRDTLLRFTRAYVEGANRFINDRELALKVIAKYTKIQNRGTLEATYEDHVPYIKKIPTPSAGSIKTVLEQLALSDPKAGSARPQDFYDGSIIAELEQDGFFSQVWR
ncbi:MAG TPA: ABC transporter substrate-binding protein, partial [Candidatus Binatia bacterium]